MGTGDGSQVNLYMKIIKEKFMHHKYNLKQTQTKKIYFGEEVHDTNKIVLDNEYGEEMDPQGKYVI
jgi:hypothetical protein